MVCQRGKRFGEGEKGMDIILDKRDMCYLVLKIFILEPGGWVYWLKSNGYLGGGGKVWKRHYRRWWTDTSWYNNEGERREECWGSY